MMEKIVIIGSSGAGKSTLARELGIILKIKFFHLDRLFWQRGWRRKTGDDRIDVLQKIVLDKQWIIEGTYLKSSEPRLDAADTIIFLDMSPLLCCSRIIKRHREYRGRPRRDLPKECTDKLDWPLIWNVLTFPFTGRKTLIQKLRRYDIPPTNESLASQAFRSDEAKPRHDSGVSERLSRNFGQVGGKEDYEAKRIIWLRSPKEVENFLAQQKQNTDNKRISSSTVTGAERRHLVATG